AIAVYGSGFLPEPAFDAGWIVPLRLNYRRQWFRIVELYAELCGRLEKYDEIISLCQDALQFEKTDEFFHEAYMDALRKSGCPADAARHYEQCAASGAAGEAFLNSIQLKSAYRSALRDISHTRGMTPSDVRAQLEELEKSNEGAIVCDKEMFFSYCHAIQHIALRMAFCAYVCILEAPDGDREQSYYAQRYNMAGLINAMKATFRKGDILCEWNDRQIFMLYISGKAMDEGALHRQVGRAVALSDTMAREIGQSEMGQRERQEIGQQEQREMGRQEPQEIGRRGPQEQREIAARASDAPAAALAPTPAGARSVGARTAAGDPGDPGDPASPFGAAAARAAAELSDPSGAAPEPGHFGSRPEPAPPGAPAAGAAGHSPLFIQVLPLVGEPDIRLFLRERKAIKND
ncbi:MAG: bacterial transcriptional activator domain-containing protein, partial [Clostridiales bacterium]|nr:bacterial transcriptional activator domain-containing protein [Clostridiales bacterium]